MKTKDDSGKKSGQKKQSKYATKLAERSKVSYGEIKEEELEKENSRPEKSPNFYRKYSAFNMLLSFDPKDVLCLLMVEVADKFNNQLFSYKSIGGKEGPDDKGSKSITARRETNEETILQFSGDVHWFFDTWNPEDNPILAGSDKHVLHFGFSFIPYDQRFDVKEGLKRNQLGEIKGSVRTVFYQPFHRVLLSNIKVKHFIAATKLYYELRRRVASEDKKIHGKVQERLKRYFAQYANDFRIFELFAEPVDMDRDPKPKSSATEAEINFLFRNLIKIT